MTLKSGALVPLHQQESERRMKANFKSKLNETPSCTVRMDGEVRGSSDFVTVLSKPTGEASIYYNTDALTLGMALKLIASSFVECMSNCTEEERQQITEVLGDAFILENLKKAEVAPTDE